MLKRVDTAVFDVIQAVADDSFVDGNKTYDLAADGVGYSTSGGFVDDIKSEIDGYAEKIKSGEIKVPDQAQGLTQHHRRHQHDNQGRARDCAVAWRPGSVALRRDRAGTRADDRPPPRSPARAPAPAPRPTRSRSVASASGSPA